MKLDANALRYLTKSHFRVLTAIEMGMRNHEIVPLELIRSIAKVRTGGVHKLMGDLLRNSLVHRDRSKYEGYRLTYMGYDYLALHTFVSRGTITGLGRQIGIGKESDIYLAVDADGRQMALKLHRLGRISFRNVRNKRDYMRNRGSKPGSWLYLSRLAAIKEFAFMKALHKHEFPVPVPIDHNRHAIVMSLCEGHPMTRVRHLDDPERVYRELMELILRLGRCGLIHGDFNEYNLICGEGEKITLIDFPQMVSTDHANARMYFERDCQGVADFFRNRLGYHGGDIPTFEDLGEKEIGLDQEVEASGFTKDMQEKFVDYLEEAKEHQDEDQSNSELEIEKAEQGEGEQADMEQEDMDEVGSSQTDENVLNAAGHATEKGDNVVDLKSVAASSSTEAAAAASSILDLAAKQATRRATAGDELQQNTDVLPCVSEQELREKIRRSVRKKQRGKGKQKGKSKGTKNQNKNREKRRLMRAARSER